MKTLKQPSVEGSLEQLLQETDKSVTFTRHITNHFYDRINNVIVCKLCKPEQSIDQISEQENKKPVRKALIKWLKQKRQDLQQFEYETIISKSEKKLIDSWIQQELLEELKTE